MATILALLGSPRRNGNSGLAMEAALRGAADGGKTEVRTIFLNEITVKPCQHCDGCLQTGRCVIPDDMAIIYESILTMEAFLLAAPVFFSGLSAQTKVVIDRCQPFWAARHVQKNDVFAGGKRPGLLIMTGGRPAYDSQFAGSLTVVKLLYKMIGVQSVGDVLVPDTDARPLAQRPAELAQAFKLGRRLFLGRPDKNAEA